MADNQGKITYSTYLKLGTGYRGNVSGLLDCVHQLSDQPEEHLFITVHHAFEIWFKQILFDMNRVRTHLDKAREARVGDEQYTEELGKIPLLFTRCRDLLRNLLENFNVIETMGQLAFINFREHLTGGSGFQSHQFRMIENTFGLKEVNRKNTDGSGCPVAHGNGPREADYKKREYFSDEQLAQLEEALKNTIFDKIQAMLEDILDQYGQAKFVEEFQDAARRMAGQEDPRLQFLHNERLYQQIHIEKANSAHVSYLSYKAFLGALIVHQFQSQPKYQFAYSIITLIVDLDEALMSWRARHVNMVHRMIGVKVGTGGTSGYSYLSSTICDRYKVFLDLFEMSTYILPSKFFD